MVNFCPVPSWNIYPEPSVFCGELFRLPCAPYLANDLGRLVRAVGQAVIPLGGVTVAVELGGAPRAVDVGGGAGAVRHVLGDAGVRVVAVLEGEDAQSPSFGEAR